MTHATRFTCLALICLLLAACGQNGPLILPEQSPAAQQTVTSEDAAKSEPEAETETVPEAVPDASQDGEPLPDVIPQAVPDPAEVSDDESI